jgi:formate dehydrogenase maturation protein FdhE
LDDFYPNCGAPQTAPLTEFITCAIIYRIGENKMEKLTDKQKKEYLDNRGMVCPVCSSEFMECIDHEFDDNMVYGICKCDKCKSQWTDTYQLVDVDLDTE